MFRIKFLILILLTTQLVCCLNDDTELINDNNRFINNLHEQIEKKRGNTEQIVLDMKLFAKFKWEKLYIFQPYTGDDEIYKSLGFVWRESLSINLIQHL